MTPALIVVVGSCFGLGMVGMGMALRSDRESTEEQHLSRLLARSRRDLPMWLLSAASGALAGMLTGWPVAIPIIGFAVYGLPKLFGRTSASVSIVRVEAIAAWTEMLQATLAASAGLSQAMVATGPLAPLVIRGATMRLAGRLTAGMNPGDALLLLADELEDPSADRVICALRLAVSARAMKLGELLMALSDSTRDEVALRLRIETSRAAVRSGVRTVMVFSVTFAVCLGILAHTYLAPFDSPSGQLMLMVVGLCYGLGLTLMVSMARPPRPVRLLGRQVIEV